MYETQAAAGYGQTMPELSDRSAGDMVEQANSRLREVRAVLENVTDALFGSEPQCTQDSNPIRMGLLGSLEMGHQLVGDIEGQVHRIRAAVIGNQPQTKR